LNTMKQLNEAMQYIEEHLLEEINFEHISRRIILPRFTSHRTENTLMNGGKEQ
jgi:hypothetical protein